MLSTIKLETKTIQTHPLLELGDFLISQSVRLGDYWDKVDFGVQSTHKFNIQLFEATARILEHGLGGNAMRRAYE